MINPGNSSVSLSHIIETLPFNSKNKYRRKKKKEKRKEKRKTREKGLRGQTLPLILRRRPFSENPSSFHPIYINRGKEEGRNS